MCICLACSGVDLHEYRLAFDRGYSQGYNIGYIWAMHTVRGVTFERRWQPNDDRT